MAAWATDEDAKTHWADAKTMDPAQLAQLLDAAQEQAEAFAPTLAEGAVIPDRYTLAVVAQARELYAAARRDGDVIAVDAYAIRARPLTSTVKQLLRPQRGRPGIG